jgi:hypothetical protein
MDHGARHRACLAGQLVRGMELACPDRRDRDQAAWRFAAPPRSSARRNRWLLVEHTSPCDRAVCLRRNCAANTRSKVLAKGHVVQPAFFFQGQ